MSTWEQMLDELVRERGPALVRYAYLFTSNRTAAEDLVQDALTRCFSRDRTCPDGARAGRMADRQAHCLADGVAHRVADRQAHRHDRPEGQGLDRQHAGGVQDVLLFREVQRPEGDETMPKAPEVKPSWAPTASAPMMPAIGNKWPTASMSTAPAGTGGSSTRTQWQGRTFPSSPGWGH